MRPPNEPGFEVRVRTDIGDSAHEVVPYVDGVELATLVTAYEQARGVDPAGGYGGIIVEHFDFGDLRSYFEGRPTSTYWTRLGQVALLGCDCGEVGCWPLYATVDADEAHAPATDCGDGGGAGTGDVGSAGERAGAPDVPGSTGSISWRDFRQPHRRQRDYSGLGPFVFDAAVYRNALSEALTVLGATD